MLRPKVQISDWITKLDNERQAKNLTTFKDMQLYKVVYTRSARLKKKVVFAVEIKLTYKKKEVRLSTGIRINDKNDFIKESNFIKGSENDTMLLQEMLRLIDDKFMILRKMNQPFGILDLKTLVTGVNYNEEEIPTIQAALLMFKKYVEVQNDNEKCVIGTIKKNKVRYNRLCEFTKETFGSNGELKEITPYHVDVFYTWLRVKRDIQNNSSQMLIGHFQRFLEFCNKNCWIPTNPFKLHKKKFEAVEVKVITKEEIEILWNTEIVVSALERTKDVFLFMLELGMNYADISALKRTDYIIHKTGAKYKVKPRTKTGISQVVPITEKAQILIDKYSNHAECLQKNIFIPLIDMMPMNRNLKQIAAICGIDKPLSTQYARRSKITGMYENGASNDEIQMIAGHKIGSDITIKSYVNSNPTVLMNRFESLKNAQNNGR